MTLLRRSRPALAAWSVAMLLAGVIGSALLAASTPSVASAETASPLVTATATVHSHTYSAGQTITGLSDGDVVAVHVDAQAPPNAVASSIFNIEGRECSSAAAINNLFDYTPTQGGNCANVALGAGSSHPVVGVAPPNKVGDMNFAVGVGTTFQDEDLTSHIITCDTTHVCKLVLRLSVPGGDEWVSFPINFGAAATAPGAPTGVSGVAGSGSVQVSWVAPGSSGGSPITGYSVVSSPAVSAPAGCTLVLALTCDFTGLANGTAYTFKVSATNVVGTGPLSAASAAVTPTAPVGSFFHALAPVRVLDSRAGFQVGPYNTPWGPATSRDVTVGGAGGVPANATAVVLNVTVADTTGGSYLTLWPKGQTKPTASSLNWTSGEVIPNAVTVKLGASGAISVFNLAGNADVIIDVAGYYDSVSGGDGFTSLTPVRVLDSRAGFQVGPYNTPWSAGTSRNVTVGGVDGVPADADAVVLNVTAADTTASSYLTLWPAGATKPTASSVNWTAGEVIPNAVTVKLGASGAISVFNLSGNADVIIDVAGYYQHATGKLFHPLDPARVLDSRAGFQVGPYNTPWGTGTSRNVSVGGQGGVDASADSVVLNVTAADTTGSSYLTLWPAGATKPTASSLNWTSGEVIPNAVTVKLGASGQISAFNLSNDVDVIIDVAGYFS
jgi:Fibronectin type III domain